MKTKVKPKKTGRTIDSMPATTSLHGVRFVYPGDGQKYYWHSQWVKGVWAKKDMDDTKVLPLFVNELKEALQWQLAE